MGILLGVWGTLCLLFLALSVLAPIGGLLYELGTPVVREGHDWEAATKVYPDPTKRMWIWYGGCAVVVVVFINLGGL